MSDALPITPDEIAAQAIEAAEADRGGLVRDAVDPDRALALGGWVVDALDQVPGERAPVGGFTDPG